MRNIYFSITALFLITLAYFGAKKIERNRIIYKEFNQIQTNLNKLAEENEKTIHKLEEIYTNENSKIGLAIKDAIETECRKHIEYLYMVSSIDFQIYKCGNSTLTYINNKKQSYITWSAPVEHSTEKKMIFINTPDKIIPSMVNQIWKNSPDVNEVLRAIKFMKALKTAKQESQT